MKNNTPDNKTERIKKFIDYADTGSFESAKDENIKLYQTTIYSTPKGKMPDSVWILQSFAQNIHRLKLSKSALDILFYFIGYLKYQNFIGIDVLTICETLDKKKSIVGKAMKELKDKNIIISIKENQDRRRNVYWINPETMYRGKALDRTKQLKEADKNKIQLNLFDSEIQFIKRSEKG
jgi:DNA-binding MarR family transcriptional regulator